MKAEKLSDSIYLLKDICFCYLVIGSKKCMLVDTGMGIGNIKKVVDKIIGDKELIVVNTHGHIDHIGNNHLFKEVYINEKEKEVLALHNSTFFKKTFTKKAPAILKLFFSKKMVTHEMNLKYFKDGETFDLGDRLIKAIEVPGHTPGSTIFLDEKNKILFGGDTLVAKLVLLNLDYSLNPKVFLNSMNLIKEISPKFDIVYPGHHFVFEDKSYIDEYINVANEAIKDNNPTLVLHDLGISKVYESGKVKLFCKVDHE